MDRAALEPLVALAARTVPGCSAASLRTAGGEALIGDRPAGREPVLSMAVPGDRAPVAVLELYAGANGATGVDAAPPDAALEDTAALSDIVAVLAALLDSPEPGAGDGGSLVRRIGHDLKTPLTSVIGFNQFLAASAEDDTARELTARVAELAQQVLVAVDTLVGFVVPLGPVSVGEVHLAAVVGEVVDDLATAGEPPAPPEVEDAWLPADRMQVRLLLRSLLHNAAAYAPTDQPVAVVGRRFDAGWDLRVSDRGPGIPEDQRAAVLEPFVRLQRDQHRPGLGVGLTVAARVVRSHGGTLRVEANPGGGTTVVASVGRDLPPGPRSG